MTAHEAPIRPEQLMIVPVNEASWDDLATIFGTTDAGRCQSVPAVQGRRLDVARLHAGGTDCGARAQTACGDGRDPSSSLRLLGISTCAMSNIRGYIGGIPRER